MKLGQGKATVVSPENVFSGHYERRKLSFFQENSTGLDSTFLPLLQVFSPKMRLWDFNSKFFVGLTGRVNWLDIRSCMREQYARKSTVVNSVTNYFIKFEFKTNICIMIWN